MRASSQIRHKIEQGELQEAITLLRTTAATSAWADELQGRFDQVQTQVSAGLITQDEANVALNRIGDDILRVHSGQMPQWLGTAPIDWPDLKRLMEKVENSWVRSVYESALEGMPLIDIPIKIDPAAVESLVPTGDRFSDQTHLADMDEVFRRANGYLLILGDAGSGKTLTMIRTVMALLQQVKEDHSRPVPVVVNLESWKATVTSCREWVIEQIAELYTESRDLVRNWIANRRLLVLFDGLDRVAETERPGCVEALNGFRVDAPYGLVVCSRPTAYDGLRVRLKLQMALRLMPLTRTQIIAYLNRIGPSQGNLQAALRSDDSLVELASTPLGLKLLCRVFRGRSSAALDQLASSDRQQQRSMLFEMYIERVFGEPVQQKQQFTEAQTRRWLGWLGRGMTNSHISLLWFERLQPSWLPSLAWQRIYLMISRVLFGLLAGLIGGFPIGLGLRGFETLQRGLVEGLLGGLVGGLTVGLYDLFLDRPVSSFFAVRLTPLLQAIATAAMLVVCIAAAVTVAFTVALAWPEEGLTVGILVGLSFGLIFAIEPKDGRRRLVNDIQAESVNQLRWSDQRARTFGWLGALIGGVGALIVAIADYLLERALGEPSGNPLTAWPTHFGLSGLPAILAVTALAFVICGLATAVIAGVTGSVINPKSRTGPTHGLRLSLQNATFIGAISALAFGVIGYLLNGWSFGLYGLFIGFLAFIWFGGLNAYLHLILRIFAWCLGLAPRPGVYVSFLSFCTELRFMQSILGGYQFSHRYWQEHFGTAQ